MALCWPAIRHCVNAKLCHKPVIQIIWYQSFWAWTWRDLWQYDQKIWDNFVKGSEGKMSSENWHWLLNRSHPQRITFCFGVFVFLVEFYSGLVQQRHNREVVGLPRNKHVLVRGQHSWGPSLFLSISLTLPLTLSFLDNYCCMVGEEEVPERTNKRQTGGCKLAPQWKCSAVKVCVCSYSCF